MYFIEHKKSKYSCGFIYLFENAEIATLQPKIYSIQNAKILYSWGFIYAVHNAEIKYSYELIPMKKPK